MKLSIFLILKFCFLNKINSYLISNFININKRIDLKYILNQKHSRLMKLRCDTSENIDILDQIINEVVINSTTDNVINNDIIEMSTEITNASDTDIEYQPIDTSYCMCSQCKTAYLLDINGIGPKGCRVQCNMCNKDWFQTPDRLMKTSTSHFITIMKTEKISEVKKILDDKNFPKYPRVDKIGVFVGNLPYTYTEKEIGDLFGEYGITNIALVRDNEQQSKGFAFIECANLKDAEVLVNEMHHFYTEPNRKLTCRLSTPGGAAGKGGVDRGVPPRGPPRDTNIRSSASVMNPSNNYNTNNNNNRSPVRTLSSTSTSNGTPVKSWSRSTGVVNNP